MEDKEGKDKDIVEFRDGEGTMVDLEGNILKETIEKREQEKAKEAPAERTVISKVQEEESVEKTMLIDSPFKDKGEPEQVAKLVVTFGNDYGKEFPITGKTTLVGRGLDCAIIVNDPSVSRKHFNILKEGDNYKLLDLGSGNGTKVNGVRVSEFTLFDGAQIEVGTTTFVFTLGTDPDKTRAIEIPMEKTKMYRPTASRQVAQIEPSQPPDLPLTLDKEAPVSSKAPLIASAVVAAAIIVVLVGHLLLGWRFIPFLVRGPSEKEIEEAHLIAEKERKLQEAKGLYEKGVKEFSEKNWDEAIRLFELVEDASVSIEGLAEAKKRAMEEKRSSEDFAEGKKAFDSGNLEKAGMLLSRIPDTSIYYTDARGLLSGLKEKGLSIAAQDIRDLVAAKKKEEARKKFNELYSVNPDSAVLLALKEELEKAGILVIQTTADTHKPPAVSAQHTAVTTKKVELGAGFSYYNSGNFSDAASSFRKLAAKSKGEEAEKYNELAEKVEEFAKNFVQGRNDAKAYLYNRAIPALTKAMSLDRNINSHYQGEIKSLLSEQYSYQSAKSFSEKKYADAALFARKALALNPSDGTAVEIDKKVREKASAIFVEAKEALKAGKKDKAKDLYRQVMKILPPQDDMYKEAYNTLNNM